MDNSGPSMAEMVTWAWVTMLASAGGAVSYYQRFKNGLAAKFTFAELIGEMGTSAFTGWITFLLCNAAELDQTVSAALVGIAGHMGARLLFKLEQWATTRFMPPEK